MLCTRTGGTWLNRWHMLQELGLEEAAAALEQHIKPKKQKRAKKVPAEGEVVERRVSAREKKPVNYAEVEARTGEPKAPVDHSARIKVGGLSASGAKGIYSNCSLTSAPALLQSITLDPETAEKLRQDLEAKRAEKKKKGGRKPRGPKDSGKGVRVQVGGAPIDRIGPAAVGLNNQTVEAPFDFLLRRAGASMTPRWASPATGEFLWPARDERSSCWLSTAYPTAPWMEAPIAMIAAV